MYKYPPYWIYVRRVFYIEIFPQKKSIKTRLIIID